MRHVLRWIGIAAAGLALGLAGVGVVYVVLDTIRAIQTDRSTDTSTHQTLPTPRTVCGFDAGWYAQDFLKKRLKAPSSARFENDPRIMDIGGGRCKVDGEVDAQNSFGVPLRIAWRAVVRETSTTWYLDYLWTSEAGVIFVRADP